MHDEGRGSRGYVAPVVIAMTALTGSNALWFVPQIAPHKDLHALVVYLLCGSGVSLVILWRALGDGRLTSRDAGLDLTGWMPAQRIVGIAFIAFFAYGGYSNLQATLPPGYVDAAQAATVDEASAPAKTATDTDATVSAEATADAALGRPGHVTVVIKPSWGDFCFWYAMLLAASLAELLVFVAVGFCLVERWLLQGKLHPFLSTTLAMLFASVAFGLYHFSHEPLWWPFVVPLMPVMFINLVLFVLTRNFYLTLGLHGSFAALGMTSLQYLDASIDPAARQNWETLAPVLVAFVVPFLALHWLEMKTAGAGR